MITSGISLIGYKRTGTYSLNSAAAPLNFFAYAKRFYASISSPRNFGKGLRAWNYAQQAASIVYQLLKVQPWAANDYCDKTEVYSAAHVVTEWQRYGDFVAINAGHVWAIIDLRTAEVVMCYYAGVSLHKCDPLDKAAHEDKKRQVEEGTWPIELPEGARFDFPKRKPFNYAKSIGFGW